MKVSVIIPTYNCAAFVGEAIESALQQSRPAHEVIVVDDGSTDDTPSILSRFGAAIVLVQQSNRGQSAARNAALARATGDAVMLLDADDVLLPHCIERSSEVLEQNSDVDVVYGDVNLIDGQSNLIAVFSDIYPAHRPSGMVLGSIGTQWSVITPSSTLIRRSALEGIEFDVSLTQSGADDFELWRQLAARSRFYYLNDVIASYRCHSGQMSANRLGEALEGAIEVQRRILEMPEFATLPRRDRARLLCHHGARHVMVGNFAVARQMFWRSLRTWPWYLPNSVLLGLGIFGDRLLQYAVLKRREVASGKVNCFIAGTSVLPKTVTNPTAIPESGMAGVACGLANGGRRG